MAISQIPNLPAATSLSGAEQLEAVQAGTSVRVTAAQIAAFANQAKAVTSSFVVVGYAVSLTTATAADVTSISLTAGDWDVEATVSFNPGGSTTITSVQAGVSLTSATLPTAPSVNGFPFSAINATLTTGQPQSLAISRLRVNVSSTTTVYLVAKSSFGASTMGAYGAITARQVS